MRRRSLLRSGERLGQEALAHGGEGEPTNYTLPALVKGDRIIADFSVPPKNAPATYAAFKGKRTERGIEWEDGNVWPKGQHKHQD